MVSTGLLGEIAMIKTTLIYIEHENCYLMLHRIKKQKDINKDKWIGVGGKFQPNEDAETCARREITEETGLTVGKLDYRGIVYFENTLCESEEMHLFTTGDFTGTLQECDEGTLEWVPIANLKKLNLWEGDKIFLKLLASNAPFFKLKLVYDGDKLIESTFLS